MNTENLKTCHLYSMFRDWGCIAYIADEPKGTEIRRSGFAEGDWNVFSDGKVEYRRRIFQISRGFYLVENQWKNVSGAPMTFAPVVVNRTLDRFTDLIVAGKDGRNIAEAPLWDEPPKHLTPDMVKIPGMTISISNRVTTGFFTDDLTASCGFTKGWEGQVDHWVIFDKHEFAADETVEKSCFYSISEPAADHPGAEEVYARAAEVLGK